MAAGKGDKLSQYELADCYQNGYGVEMNHAKAFKWFQRSAEHGEKDAQNSLGYCYQFGLGVDVNYLEAIKWYRKVETIIII